MKVPPTVTWPHLDLITSTIYPISKWSYIYRYLGLGLQQNFSGNTTQPTPRLDLRRNRCPLRLPSTSYCCYSFTKSCLTLCNPMASLSFTISPSWLKLLAIELVLSLISLLLIPCSPLLLMPSIFASIRIFANELTLGIRWPKYWSFSFSISPSNEYSGLISFRIEWFDLLAVQGTLKNLLQYHNSKVSILWCSAFFMVQLISVHDYWESNSYVRFKGPSVMLPKPQLTCIFWLSLSPVLSSFSSGPVYSILPMPMCETGVLCVYQGSPHHLSSISRGSTAFPNSNSTSHSPHLSRSRNHCSYIWSLGGRHSLAAWQDSVREHRFRVSLVAGRILGALFICLTLDKELPFLESQFLSLYKWVHNSICSAEWWSGWSGAVRVCCCHCGSLWKAVIVFSAFIFSHWLIM